MGAKPTCIRFTERVGGKLVHYWPSNYWIEPDGTNVEAEFQAAKLMLYNPWIAAAVRRMPPGRAKYNGRRFRLSKAQQKEWNSIKEDVMFHLIVGKVLDWPEEVNRPLSETSGPIVEVNFHHDNEWGDCACVNCYKIGDNKLGKLWELMRKEFVPEYVKPNPWARRAA